MLVLTRKHNHSYYRYICWHNERKGDKWQLPNTTQSVSTLSKLSYVFMYLPNPSRRALYDPRSFFKLTDFHTKVKEPSLLYTLRKEGGRENNLIHNFPNALWEMRIRSSQVWTRITWSISFESNHLQHERACACAHTCTHTHTHTHTYIYIYIYTGVFCIKQTTNKILL